MCNLYNIRSTQRTILDWTRARRDRSGNLEPALDVFPDYPAPVVRNGEDGARELVRLRWGMPTPPERVKGNADRGTTNIRNPSYAHWRRWMGIEHRCVVPATSFAEPSPTKDRNGKTPNVWFALDDSEPLFAFAGIWTRWQGVRKVKDGAADFELFGFLTTKPNAVVAPVHEKAMPVILTSQAEIETWLSAPPELALRLQRPLPDDALRIVAVTEKERYSAEVSEAASSLEEQLRLL
jgi:putative SOS response-associated peptidase YedK